MLFYCFLFSLYFNLLLFIRKISILCSLESIMNNSVYQYIFLILFFISLNLAKFRCFPRTGNFLFIQRIIFDLFYENLLNNFSKIINNINFLCTIIFKKNIKTEKIKFLLLTPLFILKELLRKMEREAFPTPQAIYRFRPQRHPISDIFFPPLGSHAARNNPRGSNWKRLHHHCCSCREMRHSLCSIHKYQSKLCIIHCYCSSRDIENRIFIRGEFKESLGMNFFSPFQPERDFKVYKSCKCSQIICSRVH